MSDGNWVVTVEFTIRPGFAEPFLQRLATQAAESLREPGCSQFDVCVDPADEHRVFRHPVREVGVAGIALILERKYDNASDRCFPVAAVAALSDGAARRLNRTPPSTPIRERTTTPIAHIAVLRFAGPAGCGTAGVPAVAPVSRLLANSAIDEHRDSGSKASARSSASCTPAGTSGRITRRLGIGSLIRRMAE